MEDRYLSLAMILRYDVYVSFNTWIDYLVNIPYILPSLPYLKGDGDLLCTS